MRTFTITTTILCDERQEACDIRDRLALEAKLLATDAGMWVGSVNEVTELSELEAIKEAISLQPV
jgi:hypothetical protein